MRKRVDVTNESHQILPFQKDRNFFQSPSVITGIIIISKKKFIPLQSATALRFTSFHLTHQKLPNARKFHPRAYQKALSIYKAARHSTTILRIMAEHQRETKATRNEWKAYTKKKFAKCRHRRQWKISSVFAAVDGLRVKKRGKH